MTDKEAAEILTVKHIEAIDIITNRMNLLLMTNQSIWNFILSKNLQDEYYIFAGSEIHDLWCKKTIN